MEERMLSTRRPTRPGLVLGLVSGAQFMVILDLAIVNVALPSIQADLGASRSGLQWVVIAYGLTLGGFLLLGGRMADLLGRRAVLVSGLGLFAAASLGAGLSGSLGWLVTFRALQGLGGALASPSALSIVTSTFAQGAARNKALGIFGAVGGGAASIGVIAGGGPPAGARRGGPSAPRGGPPPPPASTRPRRRREPHRDAQPRHPGRRGAARTLPPGADPVLLPHAGLGVRGRRRRAGDVRPGVAGGRRPGSAPPRARPWPRPRSSPGTPPWSASRSAWRSSPPSSTSRPGSARCSSSGTSCAGGRRRSPTCSTRRSGRCTNPPTPP